MKFSATLTLPLLLPLAALASWPEYFNRTAASTWSQAARVIRTLDLKQGQTVADIGAGGGYFSVLLAHEVGPGGTVYAVDISPKSIRYIRQYAGTQKVANIKTILATASDPGLKGNSVDLVFIRNTYHHIDNRVTYFRNLKKALKPGGRVVVIDYHPHIHANHSTRESSLYREMTRAGYRLHKRHTFLTRQNFNIFLAR